MNLPLSEEEIKVLFADFHGIKKYTEKVRFFDLHFNVVPFEFPEFETDIYKFFSAPGVLRLTEILRIEQKSPGLLDRVFHFQGAAYTFSIRPGNSSRYVLNNYIISKFLNRNDRLDQLVTKRQRAHRKRIKSTADLLEEACQMISYVNKRIDSDYEGKASVETKFMTVFMKGYSDCLKAVRRPVFEKRRKFLELYLYAYGFLYARYMQLLSAAGEDKDRTDLEKKIELLKELGLIEAIRRKYNSLNHQELNSKTAEIVGFITGERSKKFTDKIGSLLGAE